MFCDDDPLGFLKQTIQGTFQPSLHSKWFCGFTEYLKKYSFHKFKLCHVVVAILDFQLIKVF
jgi:hypothetical protein